MLLSDKHLRRLLARMIVFLLGVSIFLHISDAYVMHRNDAQEEPKSITTFLNGQENPESRRAPTRPTPVLERHRRRNSEDVLEDLYNNAPEAVKRPHSSEESKYHKQHLRSNDLDLSTVVNGVVDYFNKSPLIHNIRSSSGGDGETKIDLVKLVNRAFAYLASLNPKYRANRTRPKHFEPRPIELRSKDETSLLYEINTKRIVDDVTDLLSSKTMRGYVDGIARKAATIYRAVTDK